MQTSPSTEKVKDHAVLTTELTTPETDFSDDEADFSEAPEAPRAPVAPVPAELSFDDFRRYLTFKLRSGCSRGRGSLSSTAQ